MEYGKINGKGEELKKERERCEEGDRRKKTMKRDRTQKENGTSRMKSG